jgi:hypothetical protein
MDEDGCCVACGMDCSIPGLAAAFKEKEDALASAQDVLSRHAEELPEHVFQELHSALHP